MLRIFGYGSESNSKSQFNKFNFNVVERNEALHISHNFQQSPL